MEKREEFVLRELKRRNKSTGKKGEIRFKERIGMKKI